MLKYSTSSHLIVIIHERFLFVLFRPCRALVYVSLLHAAVKLRGDGGPAELYHFLVLVPETVVLRERN